MRAQGRAEQIEEVGKELRARMSWINEPTELD
jgi:hypothetical protein